MILRLRPMDLDLMALTSARESRIFTAAEARAHGVLAPDILTWIDAGVITRLRRGAYLDSTALPPPDQPHERARALHVALARSQAMMTGWPTLLSHTSAAIAHGIPLLTQPAMVHLVRADPGPGRTRASYRIHRRYGVDQHHRVLSTSSDTVNAPWLVLPVLAAFGVAEVMGFTGGVVALDHALRHKLTTPEQAQDWLDRLSGQPCSVVLRQVVDAADGSSESPLETRCRLTVQALGYEVRTQVTLCTSAGEFVARVDLLIVALGVVIEVDGRVKYVRPGGSGSPEAVLSEKRRETAICNLGYGVVRVDNDGLADARQLDARIKDAATRAEPRVIPRSQVAG